MHWSSKPLVAVVDGRAIGGGMGLACACDWVLATERSTFALPELLWGLVPAIIWPIITDRMAPHVARQWTLTAHARSAAEGLAVGLVDDLVADGQLDAAVRRATRMLRRLDPTALVRLRSWARASRQQDLTVALRRGAAMTAEMVPPARSPSPLGGVCQGRHTVVRVTRADGVARVTLDDARSGNALGEQMVPALMDAFEAVGRDSSLRAVVLEAEGDTFSSGAPKDLLLRLARRELHPTDILLPRSLLNCPVPVIAAMAGHATGGGFALGLAADMILLGEESRYGFTFMNLGFTPGMGTTVLCEHALSPAVAHELLFTGELRRGRDLARSGVNHVGPRADILPRALDIAARIALKPRLAVEMLKRTLSLPRRRAFELSLTTESLMHDITFAAAAHAGEIEAQYVE